MQKGKVIPALHFLAAASGHMAHPAPSLEKPAKAREPSELRPRSAQFKRNTPDSKVAAETAASTPPQGLLRNAYSGQNLYSAWPFLPGMKLYLKENKMDFYVSLLRVLLLNSVWVLF